MKKITTILLTLLAAVAGSVLLFGSLFNSIPARAHQNSRNPELPNMSIQGGGNIWITETVDSRSGLYNSLGLAPTTPYTPHVSYRVDSNLIHASYDGTNWVTQTVDSDGVFGTSLVIEPTTPFTPHIAYYASGGIVNFTSWSGNTWITETVATDGEILWGISLAIAPVTPYTPSIAYIGNSNLRYAKWTGSEWALETVDFATDTTFKMESPSLVISSDAPYFPHIAYHNTHNGDLNYAHWDGNQWITETIGFTGNTSQPISLVLDNAGNPHIAYKEWTELKYIYWNGSAWVSETIDSSTTGMGDLTLVLDSNDNPYIAYSGDGNLNFTSSLGGWNSETIDTIGNIGHLEMALDGDGSPKIAYAYYEDSTNQELRFAQILLLNADSGITIAQQVSPNPMQSGETAVYTLRVTNGSTLILPAVVTDSLPSQVTPTGNLTWTAVISAGTTWTQQLVVTPTTDYEGLVVNEVRVTVPTSWAKNLSYCTTCAEEDNINIPLYGDDVSRFRVTATHPAYDFTADNCAADFSGCSLATSSAPDDVTCEPLWDDGMGVITVCTDSDWWLPHTMTVTVGSASLAGHWLVWNQKIADEASWPEVLVFYQDGNMRLKPHPPSGVADVCYGSSVIVGPAPSEPIRPFVEAQTIVVDPATMSLDVTYLDGGSAHLELAVDRSQAQVDVWANYDTSDSFATFRSMYVAEDNADAARVETAVGDYALLDVASPEWTTAWSALAGPRWFFYRQAASSHNTSAPDILIEAVDGYMTHVSRFAACVNQCLIHLPVILRPE